MPKSRIATFLQAKEPLFDMALAELEKRTHHSGADAALAAEIATKAATATRTIGLSSDCSGPELYQGLINKVQEDDLHLVRQIGGTNPTDVEQIIPLVIRQVNNIDMPRKCFALKHKKAAELMGKKPPKELMKRLGYTKFDDMIKNENLAELFIAIRFTEGADWLNDFNLVYEGLTGQDFEERDIELVRFDRKKWGDVAAHFIEKKKHINTHSKELGVVAILPPVEDHMKGIAFKVLTVTLHYYNEVRLYSAFFKLLKDKKNFGEIVTSTLIADTPDIPLTQNHHIHWRVIQRYYGKIGAEKEHPEVFEPHLQPEDLHWRSAEEILYQVDQESGFWRDMDYVAVLKGEDTITFNIMDVALSYANEIPYEERYLYHFRESLWNEVFARYMGQDILREQLLVKLDNAMVKPETL
jgi:hypothetical protein